MPVWHCSHTQCAVCGKGVCIEPREGFAECPEGWQSGYTVQGKSDRNWSVEWAICGPACEVRWRMGEDETFRGDGFNYDG